jgi:hypothetical protein
MRPGRTDRVSRKHYCKIVGVGDALADPLDEGVPDLHLELVDPYAGATDGEISC